MGSEFWGIFLQFIIFNLQPLRHSKNRCVGTTEAHLFDTDSREIALAELLLADQLPFDAHRLLCKRRQADTMSEPFVGIVHVVIADGGVACHSVVPDAHGAIVPLDADL